MNYVRQPVEADRAVWALGSLVTALATTAETGDRFELLRYSAREGDAAPVHTHPDASESFYITEGQLTMLIGDDELTAPSGSFSFVSPGQPHAFRVESPTATFLQFMTPGGIFPFFEEIGEPAPSTTLPPVSDEPWDIDALLKAMERHGMEVVGPPPGAQ